MRKSTVVLIAISLPVLIVLAIILWPRANTQPPPTKNLTVWGFASQDEMQNLLTAFHNKSPYINLTYVQVDKDGLQEKLLRQWALGTGPDVVMIPSEQLVEYQPFLSPAPATINQYTYSTKKTLGIKEETTVTKSTVAGPSVNMLRQNYIDTVTNDAVIGQKVYGIPLSVDTLVLFSNRDLLNQAQIALPANTWEQFVNQVPRLTILDSNNNLVQSGAALGTGTNIPHAFDILSLIILQNGSDIIDPTSGNVTFTGDASTQQAVTFYTDFARASKVVYSWNDKQEDALNAFAAGKVAYYIGFNEDDAKIKQRSVGLNYDITAVPQISINHPVNIASYSLLSVAKSSTHQNSSWAFVNFVTRKNISAIYANTSFKTPARKDLLNQLITSQENSLYGVLAGQALTARNWYRGPNYEKAESVLNDLITAASQGSLLPEAINSAASQLRIIQS